MLKYFNTTNISIIPKTKEPKTFADFRPISLCNSVYKIIKKAIYLRMLRFISFLVTLNKEALSPEEKLWKVIGDNEVLHSIISAL